MTAEVKSDEYIGKYRVHPVASMFPLLEGQDYEDLHNSIESYGQLKPIVMQGDLLLDGRNRLKVCLELGVEPRLEQYAGSLDPVDYILVVNVDRRHLSPDARTAICFQIRAWRIEQRNAARKAEVGAAQGHHGTEGGRGKKKPLDTNSDPGVSKRDITEKNAKSTVGQLAHEAKVSHHKAAQAVAVGKAAPELLQQVAKGEVKLKDAHAKVKAAAPSRPPKDASKPRKYDVEKAVASGARTISILIANCPAPNRAEFKTLLLEECKRLCAK